MQPDEHTDQAQLKTLSQFSLRLVDKHTSLEELQYAIEMLLHGHTRQLDFQHSGKTLEVTYFTPQNDYDLHFERDWAARILLHLSLRSDIHPKLKVMISTSSSVWQCDTVHARLRYVSRRNTP